MRGEVPGFRFFTGKALPSVRQIRAVCVLQATCHFHYGFLKDFRVVRLLSFDDRKFFVVPFGQVSCGCGG